MRPPKRVSAVKKGYVCVLEWITCHVGGTLLGDSPQFFCMQEWKGGRFEPPIMKASVKLRRDQEGRVQKKPIVKAKLPFDFLGFPVHAGLKVCGHIQELALRLSCAHQEAGPSLEVSYRPHEQDRPFTLSLKTGFSPWPSSPASALTMAAEFSLSRPSNPTFLLKVKPQLGDFSFRHDFRSEVRGGGGTTGSSSDDHRHTDDGSSSDTGLTNAFARYASRLHLPDNASSPWHDTATNESFDAGQRPRYDALGNANLASFDSTPYASEKAGYARLDFAKFSSEFPTTPLQIFPEEKRFQEVVQHTSTGTDWGPLRDNMSSQNPGFAQRAPRMDDDWERVGDAVSRSTTSASSSTQQNRGNDHATVRRHSRSTGSLAGWAVRGFCGGGHLRACTRLPISPEAHLKVRWSVGASSSSSRVPLLPILMLDKVSLEAAAPGTGARRMPVLSSFLNAPKSDTPQENVTHLKQVEISLSKKVRDETMSEGGPDYTDLEGELKPVHDLHADNVNMKNPSFFSQFLHGGKGLLD
eukprot:c16491_g1_i1 orf=444-2018(-)